MVTFALLGLGIFALLVGGTLLVRGASSLASNLGVSPLLVGLTVVAFGTSAPELVVNVTGALEGETALAFGNVVGSNIANFGLVLGLAALVSPIVIQGSLIRRELPLLLLATSVVVVMALDVPLRGDARVLDRSDGLILLLLFSIFIYVTVLDVMGRRHDPLLEVVGHLPLPGADAGLRRDVMFVVAGALALMVGGHMTITYGAALAESLMLSKTAVGIAIVAVGTSLPELVTSIVAAARREADLSLGNVVGSNIFNSLLVLPVSALVTPIEVPPGGLGDLVVSFLLAAALIPIFFVGRSRLGRPVGLVLLLFYLFYVGYRVMSGAAA